MVNSAANGAKDTTLTIANDLMTHGVTLDEEHFPDPAFRHVVAETFDKDGDGVLNPQEIVAATHLSTGSTRVFSVEGVEFLLYLTSLELRDCPMKTMDISHNSRLESLTLSECLKLRKLDLSHNPNLMRLHLRGVRLDTVDVSHNTKIASIRLRLCPALRRIVVPTGQDRTWLRGILQRGMGMDFSEIWFTKLAISMPVPLDAEHFPDPVFRKVVADTFDTDGDNILTPEEMDDATELSAVAMDIVSAQGVEFLTSLTRLDLSENQLTDINVGRNISLTTLHLHGNHLTNVDISRNERLSELDVSHNYLSDIDVGGNPHLVSLDLSACPLLANVWLPEGKDAAWLKKILHAGMRSDFTQSWFDGLSVIMPVPLDEAHFPDPTFRAIVAKTFDMDWNGTLNAMEIANATRLDVRHKGIHSVKGVEYLTQLTVLDLSDNELEEIDVSHNTRLTTLGLFGNKLSHLDVSALSQLSMLYAGDNRLEDVDVSCNTQLVALGLGGNRLTNVDVSHNSQLVQLRLHDNRLEDVDVSHNTQLTGLDIGGNRLEDVDVSHNTQLLWLYLDDTPLTSVDISHNPRLAGLDLSSCPSLRTVITPVNTDRDWLRRILRRRMGMEFTEKWFDHIQSAKAASLIPIDATTFPDAAFRAAVAESFDMDGDGYLVPEDIEKATTLVAARRGITSLTGIGILKNLTHVDLNSNELEEADFSGNLLLRDINLCNNHISRLNVSANEQLVTLDAGCNQLTQIEVSRNKNLTHLNLCNNDLTTIDLSWNSLMDDLDLHGNPMTQIDTSWCPWLIRLDLRDTRVEELDVSRNRKLVALQLRGTPVASLAAPRGVDLEIISDLSPAELSHIDITLRTA